MLIRRPLRPILVGATVALLFSTRAIALFHFWDINEIYTNADGTIQFIEFTTNATIQEFLTGEVFTSTSNQFTFPNNLTTPPSTAGRSFLMATSGFAALPGAVAPDYVMPDNFFAVIGGDTLTLVDTPTNADVVAFGPGILPTNGVLSLNRNMTTSANSPTNFAGQTGTGINVPPLDREDVFVDFDTTDPEFGTEVLPFDTLQEALDVVEPPATINLEPGPYDETFSGPGISDTDTLTLVNNNPGGGSVLIGVPQVRTENRSGFRSKPIASASTRSGAP